MGRKLDALLGKRSFSASKLRPLLSLSLSRLAVLKNQRHFRYLQARSDVLQLLQLGNHERAVLRVEQVVKEQNLLDVYSMIESYFNLLIERVDLLEKQRECPDELKEAISGLLFASSRCGDFPELLQIRTAFTANFGKDFVARAVELRNNCGVNPTMIQKLSTRQETLEVRTKILKEIAFENNISLQLDEDSRSGTGQNAEEESKDGLKPPSEKTATEEGGSSGSMKARRKYKDVADAAQAAFESAAYAAEAARAAVELSRSESQDPDEVTTVKAKQTENSGELKSYKSDSEDGMKTSNTSMIRERGSDSDDSDDDSGNQQESIPSPNQVPPARFQSDMKPKAALGRNPFPTSVRTRGVRGY